MKKPINNINQIRMEIKVFISIICLFPFMGLLNAQKVKTDRLAIEYANIRVGGELQTRLEQSFNRLHDDRYKRENLFTTTQDPKWPGDMEGRTALALTLLAQSLHAEAPEIDDLYADFSTHYNKNGYFGKIYLPDEVDEQQLSGNGWTLRALCEYYIWKKKPETKTQISRLIENLVLPTLGMHALYPVVPAGRENKGMESGEVIAKVGKWRLSSDLGCDFIFYDGVVQAYGVTSDKRLIPVINEMTEKFLEIDVVTIKAQTHATLSGIRGLIRWSQLSGNPDLLSKAEKMFHMYLDEACTENFENYCWFGRPEWTEPCAIIDSYLIACQLWQYTGKPEYLESAQWIYFNGIAATQRSNGGFGLNNCSGAKDPFLHTYVTEAYWCCTMRGGEGLASASKYSAFTDESGIWITTFMDNNITTHVSSGLLELDQKSNYPFSCKTIITIKNSPALACEIRLFAPSFIKPGTLLVNQKKITGSTHNGFIILKRKWKAGDVLEFDFTPVLESKPVHGHNTISGFETFHYGPLMLSSTCREQPTDANVSPSVLMENGKLENVAEGKWKIGTLELEPIYHLLNPDYDQIAGSWRQVLFPLANTNLK